MTERNTGSDVETPLNDQNVEKNLASGFDLRWLDRSRRHVRILSVILGGVIIAASLIKVDVFARALGRVSAESYTSSIDAPRNGHVGKLLVPDGAAVSVGQPILEFDCKTERAQHEAAKAHLDQLQQRLDVHVLLSKNIVPGYRDRDASAISGQPRAEAELQTSLYSEAKLSAKQAVRRSEAAVDGANARLVAARADQRLKQTSFNRIKELSDRGFATRAALDQREAELRQSASAVELAQAQVSEAREAVRQLRADSARVELEGQSKALQTVATVEAEVLELRTEIARLENGLNLCVVDAPAKGQLFWLDSLTPGTWVRVDDALSKIVPQGQPMIIQAMLPGQDIPFVRVGQPAVIKLSSLPFIRYGTLSGHVRFVSPDSITDEAGKSAYRIDIEVTSISPEARRALPTLISGLDVEVNVITDNRRLIGYFFEPIILAFRESFHER
jgi:HlyD family type I secretion membrane fusion protein